jgi:hypothetical protein
MKLRENGDDPAKDIDKVIVYEISFVEKAYKGLIEDAQRVVDRAGLIEERMNVLIKTLSKTYPNLLTAFDDRKNKPNSYITTNTDN